MPIVTLVVGPRNWTVRHSARVTIIIQPKEASWPGIDRKMDAKHIDFTDVARLQSFNVYDYEIRQSHGVDNWIKCLIGTPELDSDGQQTGRELAYEFHGNSQGLIQWLRKVEQSFPGRSFLPLEDCRISNQCGYIFDNSSNQLQYIDSNYGH